MNPTTWKKTLFPGKRPRAFPFVAGLRHPVGIGNACGLHSHRAVEIVYHPAGCGVTRLHGEPFAFEEGSIVIYAPMERHDQFMSTAGEDLCVQVSVPKAMAARLVAGLYLARLEIPWIIGEIQWLCRLSSPADEAERSVLDLRATAVLLGLVQAACAGSENLADSIGMRHVRKAERFMQERFATIHSLCEVASDAGVSHDHLRHLFKSLRGKPLIAYLNEVRVARARLLLAQSALPLKQIATLCGFKDEYYLSTVFRRLEAMPPGVYRHQAGMN